MEKIGKYLGLDYGDRRVGVSISDPKRAIAFAREALIYVDLKELIKKIVLICKEEGVLKIILGWPLHTNGEEGERTRLTEQFASELKKSLPLVQVEFFDERFTTKWAISKLHQAGLKTKDQKKERDSLAAQIMLQTYLDIKS